MPLSCLSLEGGLLSLGKHANATYAAQKVGQALDHQALRITELICTPGVSL